jgi:hypothetical protein
MQEIMMEASLVNDISHAIIIMAFLYLQNEISAIQVNNDISKTTKSTILNELEKPSPFSNPSDVKQRVAQFENFIAMENIQKVTTRTSRSCSCASDTDYSFRAKLRSMEAQLEKEIEKRTLHEAREKKLEGEYNGNY